MKRCKKCGRKMTKKLHLLRDNEVVEEYKDGLCIDCWIKTHKQDLVRYSMIINA